MNPCMLELIILKHFRSSGLSSSLDFLFVNLSSFASTYFQKHITTGLIGHNLPVACSLFSEHCQSVSHAMMKREDDTGTETTTKSYGRTRGRQSYVTRNNTHPFLLSSSPRGTFKNEHYPKTFHAGMSVPTGLMLCLIVL